MRLGQHIATLGRFPRLLQVGLHNVFNAAVVLLLHQLLVEAPDETDRSGISFVISAFENEAKTGNIYADDCMRVLLDLNMLVQKLRSQIFFGGQQQVPTSSHAAGLQTQANQYTNIYAEAPGSSRTFGWRPEEVEQAAPLQVPVGEQDPAYQELVTWLSVDDLQLYNI